MGFHSHYRHVLTSLGFTFITKIFQSVTEREFDDSGKAGAWFLGGGALYLLN